MTDVKDFEKVIRIAELFTKWLDETSEDIGIDKNLLQAIIKQFLVG